MRNAKQEKVEDIVAEMRNEWAEVYYSEGTRRRDGAYCDNKFVAIEPSEVSDRIEAAANREREAGAEAAQICGEIGEMVGREAACEKSSQVGNSAAMREALEQIDRIVYFKKRHTKEEVEAHRLATTVLTMPPRNCDVGTPEEQSARFDAHCRKHMGCLTCPLREKDGGVPKHCEFAWSQMPYEEGGDK